MIIYTYCKIFVTFIICCCCSVVFLGVVSSTTAVAQNVIGDNSEKKINSTHYKTNVNGIQLHYVMDGKGEGDPIVLLHGFPQT